MDQPSEVVDPKQLTEVYKKNGSFDKQRKKLLENFKESETHSNLLLKLKLMVENKVKNDPSILMRNKGKMGALIQGEIISEHNNSENSLLSIVDKDIQEKIIESPEFHNILKTELKDIKRKMQGIGDEEFAKQLEEEAKQEQQQGDDNEKLTADKEVAYRNNFRVKHLKQPSQHYKVTKAPRINISRATGDRKTDEPYNKPPDFLKY